LKELHRLPPLPQDQTSARLRYLTATTNAAQRLRAVGLVNVSWSDDAHIATSGKKVLPLVCVRHFTAEMLKSP
jgi:hypothetical protein